MRFLITGGAGFIGSNFIRYILGKYKNIHIVNLDALTYSGNQDNLKDTSSNRRYSFIKGDVANPVLIDKIFKKYKTCIVLANVRFFKIGDR